MIPLNVAWLVELQAKLPERKVAPADVEKRQLAQQKAARTRAKNAKAERTAALKANREKRLARQAALRQKVEPEKAPGLSQIPAQVAHCMMAVHAKRGKSKRGAWNICRWSLTKKKYLKGPYRVNTKLPKAVKQTAKGTMRSFQHGMEKKPLNGGLPGNGATKYRKFTGMFGSLERSILPKE